MTIVKIAPSILSADFSRLGAQVEEALQAGTRWIHVDVMDGHFVPNITVGPLVVRALRPLADRFEAIIDTHLMIESPGSYVAAFAEAGADMINVHVEADPNLHRTLQTIREYGARPGVTLNPGTPLNAIEEALYEVDLVLVMSVNPGFGGQSYIPRTTERIRSLRRLLDEMGSTAALQVDGGIKAHNAAAVAVAGADVLVAGSAIYGGPNSITENIEAMRRTLRDAGLQVQ